MANPDIVQDGLATKDIEPLIGSFEDAWRRGERPRLADYVPSEPRRRQAVLWELIHTELEYRIRAGDAVRVEEYFAAFPELSASSEQAVELIEAEHQLLRQQQRERPVAEYFQRFPEHTEALRRRLALANPADAAGAGNEATTVRFTPTSDTASQYGAPTDTAAVVLAPDVPGFEITGELGRGGMGVVYRARQTALKRDVALKMLLGGAVADAEALARFRAEAAAAARLQHPHIVQIFEIGEHAGLPYFALELVEGGSLKQRLRGAPQPPREAARLTETLARAVHAAHGRGIIHRDLKPANVLMAADGTPKIGDFGLAKRLDDDSVRTYTGQVMGTPSYMAPEQAAGDVGRIGPAADVWSLGALLYELLTGRPPFHAASVLETLDQVRTLEPVPPRRLLPGLPRDLETICLKCLRKPIEARYPTAEALADDLRRFEEGRHILARPVGRVEKVWRWCRRKPAVAALVVTLVLALAAGLATGLRLRADRLQLEARGAETRQEIDGLLIEALRLADESSAAAGRPESRRKALVRATEQLQLASAAAGRNEDAVDDFIRGRLAAAQRRLSAEEENLTLVEALDEVWMNLGIHRDRPDGSDYASREPLYLQVRAALARCDIQVGETPLDQARAWLADKPSELAVQVRATVPLALEAAPSAHRDWLLAWLNQACSNPFETRVHEALAAQDVAALTDLLDDPDWTKMPLLLRLRALQRLPAALTARRIDELRRLRREHLDNPYAQFELVRTVLDAKAGSGDELADSLARAVDLRPGNPRLRMAYGIALQSKGDLQGGVALLRRTIEMAPDLAEAHFTLALALGRQNELRTAITHAREVVRLQPEYAEGHYYLANLLQRQHDYPSAIAALREAIRLNPDYVNARYNLGYLLAQTEDYPGAIRNLRVAVEHRPSFFEAQYWLGIALGRAGDFAAAIPPLREAVRLRPHTAQTWNDLGTVLNAVNDLTGALAACEQALRLQPVYPEASFISGVIKQQFGDLEGSKAALAKAIEHKPDFAAALHYQALTFMYQGDFADGLALVRKADVLSKTVPGWNLPSAAIVQAGERFVEWDARFEQLLRDAVIPQTVDEQVQFATFCAAKRRHGVAARVLATALLAKPDQKAIYCLDAAKHAVLAAFAADTDDSPDNQKQRADFCMQAHGWLRHQVELNEASLGKKSQEGDNAVRLRAQWMKHHRDFASVREPEQLAKLPANEQALWRQLWQDVDRQLERVALP